MSGVFARIGRFFGRSKTYIGKDLEGNTFYELPAVNGGRMKRVVEYRVQRDIADYTSGTQRLPVQWTTWLSHTRQTPPTIAELQADFERRRDLQPMISAIAEREREERIRQGYLIEESNTGASVGQIAGPGSHFAGRGPDAARRGPVSAGPSSRPVQGASGRMNLRPSFSEATAEISSRPTDASAPLTRGQGGRLAEEVATSPDAAVQPSAAEVQPRARASGSAAQPPQQSKSEEQRRVPHARDGLDLPASATAYPVPTPPSQDIAPSRDTVDPLKHNSADELRRLSMEDTQRRIDESGKKVDVPSAKEDKGPQGAVSGGLKPRRRRG